MKNVIAIIPAAGLGTRLFPFTRYLPKEMMPLGEFPAIHYTIQEILAAGIEQIILITAKGKNAIIEYLTQDPLGPKLSPKQLYITEQSKQLGLGHAVLCAEQIIAQHQIPVSALAIAAPDDILLPRTMAKIKSFTPPSTTPLAFVQLLNHYQQKPACWVAVEQIKNSDTKKYGVLHVTKKQGQIIYADDLFEKPEPSAALAFEGKYFGIIARYILPIEIFKTLATTGKGAGGEIQLTDAIKTLIKGSKKPYQFFGLNTNLQRLDIGNIRGLWEANYFIRYSTMPE